MKIFSEQWVIVPTWKEDLPVWSVRLDKKFLGQTYMKLYLSIGSYSKTIYMNPYKQLADIFYTEEKAEKGLKLAKDKRDAKEHARLDKKNDIRKERKVPPYLFVKDE